MHADVTHVATSQREIGWNNALKGFLATAWTGLASRNVNDPSSVDTQCAHQRLRVTIRALYQYTRLLWTTRNAALHSCDPEATETIRNTVNADIRHYYQHRELIQFEDNIRRCVLFRLSFFVSDFFIYLNYFFNLHYNLFCYQMFMVINHCAWFSLTLNCNI
jgi:hypothetical protein